MQDYRIESLKLKLLNATLLVQESPLQETLNTVTALLSSRSSQAPNLGSCSRQKYLRKGYMLVTLEDAPCQRASASLAAIHRVTQQGSVMFRTNSGALWDETRFWVFQGSQLIPGLAFILQLPPSSYRADLLVMLHKIA